MRSLTTALAHSAGQTHVRGSIVSVKGNVIKVNTRQGNIVDVTLADGGDGADELETTLDRSGRHYESIDLVDAF